jgi:hypothetical protein
MKNNKRKNMPGRSYYYITSVPYYFQQPLVPMQKIDLQDEAFVNGLRLSKTMLAFRVFTNEDNTIFSLGLEGGDFLDLVVPKDKANITWGEIVSNSGVELMLDRKLHRASCTVQSKICTRGSGITEPIVGWYNTLRHSPLHVRDVYDILSGTTDRYKSYINEEAQWYCDWVVQPKHNHWTDKYIWSKNDRDVSVAPMFLQNTLKAYRTDTTQTGITTHVKTQHLPVLKSLIWNADALSELSLSIHGKTMQSTRGLNQIKCSGNWTQVNQGHELDSKALSIASQVCVKRKPKLAAV